MNANLNINFIYVVASVVACGVYCCLFIVVFACCLLVLFLLLSE